MLDDWLMSARMFAYVCVYEMQESMTKENEEVKLSLSSLMNVDSAPYMYTESQHVATETKHHHTNYMNVNNTHQQFWCTHSRTNRH